MRCEEGGVNWNFSDGKVTGAKFRIGGWEQQNPPITRVVGAGGWRATRPAPPGDAPRVRVSVVKMTRYHALSV